jgi:glutamine cyclotransferase
MRYVTRVVLPSLLLLAMSAGSAAGQAPVYGYEIVRQYPHDTSAFTEGLVLTDSGLYESTGLYGSSSLRKVHLQTGAVLKKVNVDPAYFAEGMTIFQGKIFQLTYQSQTAFVYDPVTFARIGQFFYTGEGWGLTHNDQHLIMSDGTNRIRFLDPVSFQPVRSINVYDDEGAPVPNINELEYINGEIYANIWLTNWVVRIDPVSGKVVGWIDFTGLLPAGTPADVLNGIAYDEASGHLLVTGKFWPSLFEVRLIGGAAPASPDGTMVPTATQIVDNVGAVWTIGANSAILRNGVQAGGGWGSKILWKNATIYVFGSDGNWWQWTGSGWLNVGTTTPGEGGTQPTSPDGTMVPTAAQIVDNVGAVWTIGASGAILRNGVQAGDGWGSKILWKSNTIYVLGGDTNWWQWTGSGWLNVGTTVPGGSSGSPDGTMVPTATQIVDNAGAVWTIGANSAILRNGVQAGGGWGSKILWKNATIYVFGTDSNWWQWTGSGWINVGTSTPGGTQPTSPDGTTVPTATQIVDNAGAVWTIGANSAILRNGAQAAGGLGSKILWKSNAIYVLGVDSNWWKWTGSGWINGGPITP